MAGSLRKERDIFKIDLSGSAKGFEEQDANQYVNENQECGNSKQKFDDDLIIGGKKAIQVQIPKPGNVEESPKLEDELHNNDKKILSLLINEDSSRFSFTGMKRKLNVHQQSLARALARLEELGLVEKSDAGYGLNKNADTSSSKIVKKPSPIFSKSSINFQLLHASIPVQIEVEDILIGLHGKWFDKYRFVELKKTNNGYALKWVNEATSFELTLLIIGNYCVIETNAISGKSRLEAMFGASRIIKEITTILQRKLDDFSVSTIKIDDFSLTEHVN